MHQHARFQGQRPLRLEATYWSGPLRCTPTPPGWVLGLCNIVDAWLCGLPDLPDPHDPELTAIVLSTMAVHCTVAAGHPLLRRDPLDVEALADFPSLAMPEGAYPKVEEGLKAMGGQLTVFAHHAWITEHHLWHPGAYELVEAVAEEHPRTIAVAWIGGTGPVGTATEWS